MANENVTNNISGGTHYWATTGTSSTPPVTTTITTPVSEEVVEAITEEIEEVLKGKAGGSVGGHDPRANKNPLRHLVRSYGKWANGRFSKCTTVLSKHPELVAKGGGNVNALCAWLKDQWAGTTKWRGTGPKQKAEDKAIQVAARARNREDGSDDTTDDEYTITPPEWLDNDLVVSLANYFDGLLADEEKNGVAEGLERDVPHATLDAIVDPGEEFEYDIPMSNDLRSETTEAEMSHNEIHSSLGKLLREAYKKKEYAPEVAYDDYHPYIKEVYDEYIIFCLGDREFKLGYSVKDDEVTLTGERIEVTQTWIPVKDSKEEGEEPEAEAPTGEPAQNSPENDPEAKVDPEKQEAPVPTKATAPDNHNWVTIRGPKGDFVVLINTKSMSIVRGPKRLVGKKLPTIPRELAGQLKEGEDETKDGNTLPWRDCVKAQMKTGKSMPEAIKACVAMRKTQSKEAREETKEAQAEHEAEAQAVLVGESAAEDVNITEVFADLTDVVFAETSEAGGDSSSLTTPSGREVDAIIRIISPGPGNKRDNFYYPAEVIKRDIKVIAEGKKMYIDHLTEDQEKRLQGRPRSVNDWAAVIEEAWSDSNTGEGFGGVKFVDSTFQEKVKKGYKYLGVSIRSQASAKPGMVGGKQYRVIENFISGKSVDFVTEAGARGGFVAVAESNSEEDLADMDLNDLDLDQLQEARPDLLTQYLEAVDAERELNEEQTESEAEKTVSLSLEDVQKLIADAKAEARDEAIKEADVRIEKNNTLATQRAKTDALLNKSGLKAASQQVIRAELHDKYFEPIVSESGEIETSSLEQFEAFAQEMIDNKIREISEYVKPQTRVTGLGPTKTSSEKKVEEGSKEEVSTPEPITGRSNRHIDSLLGISNTSKS